MEYFSIIYRILKIIESSMDAEEFDAKAISPEALHISETRWHIIMGELIQNGYIRGASFVPLPGHEVTQVRITRPILTIKGAEYLHENTMMQKAYKLAKGINDIIP